MNIVIAVDSFGLYEQYHDHFKVGDVKSFPVYTGVISIILNDYTEKCIIRKQGAVHLICGKVIRAGAFSIDVDCGDVILELDLLTEKFDLGDYIHAEVEFYFDSMDWVSGPGVEFDYHDDNAWEIKALESVLTLDSLYKDEAPESYKDLNERVMVKDMGDVWELDGYEFKYVDVSYELHCQLLPNTDNRLSSSDYRVKLYLGDSRSAPAGWTKCCDAEEAIEFLKAGLVVNVQMDFVCKSNDCTAVLLWMESAIKQRDFYPPEIEVISENSSRESEIQTILGKLSDYKKTNIQSLQDSLASDRRAAIRLRLASDKDITEATACQLIEDNHFIVLSTLAANPALSSASQLKIAQLKHHKTLGALASNTSLIPELKTKFLTSDIVGVRALLASNSSIDDSMQKTLLQDSSITVRMELAKNTRLAESVQEVLCKDSVDDVRISLAENPSLKGDVFNCLLNDDFYEVVRCAEKNPLLSKEQQEDIFYNKGSSSSLTFNPSLTAELQEKIADSYDAWALELLENPSLTDEMQIKLLNDDRLCNKSALAENPAISEKIEMVLVDHWDDELRATYASRNGLTLFAMRKLARDCSEDVRLELASSIQIPESIQMILAEDKCLDIQMDLRANENLCSNARNRLIELGVIKSL